MRVVFFYLSLMIFFCCQTVFAQDDSMKGAFNLYLLSNVKASQLSGLKIDKLKPRGKPFLSKEHIERYVKDTHEIQLNILGVERLKKLKVPVSGKPFVVFAGGEAIYTGAFWHSFSSISFKGAVINVANLEGYFLPSIRIDMDYPPRSPKNIASDPRADARVMRALEQDEILYEQVWFRAKCKKIRSTGKRHQSYIFTFAPTSAVKAKYDAPEISFELYSDFGGEKMRAALQAEYVSGSRTEQAWDFDPQKEILLKFERQVTTQPNPQIYLEGFEVD